MNDYVRSQYLTWLIDAWEDFETDLSDEVGARRDRWSRRKAQQYIGSVGATVSSLHTKMKPGAPLVLILGQSQSAIARELNPARAVVSAAKEAGFELLWETERRVRFRKINNTPYRLETICVFRNE